MRIATIILLLALPLGCDPAAANSERERSAVCHDACTDPQLSATDRTTCRLNCQTLYKLTPVPLPPALAAAANCMGACPGHGDAAKLCVDACRDPNTTPVVLDALATCVSDCRTAAHGDDERATCRLLCAQQAAPSR